MAASRQKLISNAERLVSRGKLQAAIGQYRKLLAENPDDTSTLNRVGDLYARLDQVDQAIDLFSQAADHFTQEGFFLKGIAIHKKIIRLDPARIESGAKLAALQRRQGLTTDARVQYQAVAKQYLQGSDTESAIRIYKELVDLEPTNPSHRLHLAELHQQSDQLPEAMAQFREIAGLMLSHGRIEEATQVCLKALDVAPKELGFLNGVLQDLRARGLDEEADRVMAIAIEKNPEAEQAISQAPAVAQEPEPEEPEVEVEEVQEVQEGEVEALDESLLQEALEETIAAEVAEAKEELEEEVEFEIDLDDIEDLEVEEPFSKVAVERTEAEESALDESAEAELERKSELLIEADVLARYGMEDKAVERLEKLLELAEEDPEVHCRLITLHLELKNTDRVTELANQLAGFEENQDVEDAWESVQKLLINDGFTIEERHVTPPEQEVVEPEEEAAEEIAVEAVEGQEDASWLEEVSQEVVEAKAAGEALFEQEDEFFDLATELEKELEDEVELEGEELLVAPEEQSLEEIVEGFKKGMAETLSAEDYDTHYNLGIAYREMGLVDEAIGEFQLAAKDARYLVDCCSLLATCFLEKGFPELAVKWYKEGLESPTISEEETLGLWYELGDLYFSIGEEDQARQQFVEIYGINSSYRDVGSRLEQLGEG
jgi:tetratricopeptide (TPR) repeat protein